MCHASSTRHTTGRRATGAVALALVLSLTLSACDVVDAIKNIALAIASQGLSFSSDGSVGIGKEFKIGGRAEVTFNAGQKVDDAVEKYKTDLQNGINTAVGTGDYTTLGNLGFTGPVTGANDLDGILTGTGIQPCGVDDICTFVKALDGPGGLTVAGNGVPSACTIDDICTLVKDLDIDENGDGKVDEQDKDLKKKKNANAPVGQTVGEYTAALKDFNDTADKLVSSVGNMVTLLTKYNDLVQRLNEATDALAAIDANPDPNNTGGDELRTRVRELPGQREAVRKDVESKLAEINALLAKRQVQGAGDPLLRDTLNALNKNLAVPDPLPKGILDDFSNRYKEYDNDEKAAKRNLDELARRAGRPIDLTKPESVWNALPYDLKLCLNGGSTGVLTVWGVAGISGLLVRGGLGAAAGAAPASLTAGAVTSVGGFIFGCGAEIWKNG